MPHQIDWPEWWDWELDLSLDHLREQMIRRRFNETDVREMLATAAGYRESAEFGRWVIETIHESDAWEVIVEPQPAEKLLLVITAYMAEPL